MCWDIVRRAITLQCLFLFSLVFSQRRDFNAWSTSIFRKGYDHIRRRPKIFEEASTISEGIGGYEGPFADLQYTLMLSPVSLFSETSLGGVGRYFARKSFRDFNGKSFIAVCDRTLIRGYQAHFLRGCEEDKKTFWLSTYPRFDASAPRQ